jgi:hypothetical protein
MKSSVSLLFVLAPLVAAVAVACGGSTSTSTATDVDAGGGADAGVDAKTEDAAVRDAETDANADLFPSDTTKIVITEKGGFVPAPPAGSACSLIDQTYTLLLASRELSWKFCEATDAGPNAYRTGQTTIATADFNALSSALHGLRRATQTQCGADAPEQVIVFSTPSGDATYYDDFYFCDANDPKPYVKGLDAVFAELRKHAK